MSKIVSIRRVKNGSLQAEMTGYIERPGTVNVLRALNKGDERFNTGTQRRAWFPVTLTSLSELGLDSSELAKVDSMKEGEKMPLSIENPKVKGESLEIQVVETINPGDYQKANVMSTAKRIQITDAIAKNKGIKTSFDLSNYMGQNGYFLDKDGNHIFSRTTVNVASQVNHTFVSGELVPEKELANFGATLAAPTKEFVEVEQD